MTPSLTFECLVKLIFPKDNTEVMKSTGVKLHPEHHISTRSSVALVIAFELKGKKKKESHEGVSPKDHNRYV